MRLQYANGKFKVEFEDKNPIGLFEQLATFQEMFEQTTCGKCNGTNVRFCVRHVDKYTYYEVRCRSKGCGAKLSFGRHQDTDTLFPKLKDEKEGYLPNGGWVKWDSEKEEYV